MTGETTGLSEVQRRFLGKCRRDPKPVEQMLKECRVGMATFLRWRKESAFERAFRRATSGLTTDTLADLRIAFALCGRMISGRVFDAAEGDEKTKGRKRRGKNRRKALGTLQGAKYRLCFDVVKMGMGAFVRKTAPRKARRAFPKVDGGALARLREAQEGGEVGGPAGGG